MKYNRKINSCYSDLISEIKSCYSNLIRRTTNLLSTFLPLVGIASFGLILRLIRLYFIRGVILLKIMLFVKSIAQITLYVIVTCKGGMFTLPYFKAHFVKSTSYKAPNKHRFTYNNLSIFEPFSILIPCNLQFISSQI